MPRSNSSSNSELDLPLVWVGTRSQHLTRTMVAIWTDLGYIEEGYDHEDGGQTTEEEA
jgi:hypothetical protein